MAPGSAPPASAPAQSQWRTMLRFRVLLYSRNRALLLLGLLVPLAMVAIAIGMSALIQSSVPSIVKGASITGVPLFSPVGAGFDANGMMAPPVLVAGADTPALRADPRSFAALRDTAGTFLKTTGLRDRVYWREVDGGLDALNAVQIEILRRYPAGSLDWFESDPTKFQPLAGFMLHSPATAPDVNLSLVINQDPGMGRALIRTPTVMLNALHHALQGVVASAPDAALIGGAGQDPSGATAVQGAPSGQAAQQVIDKVMSLLANATASPSAPALPPWFLMLNGTVSTFPALQSDVIDISISIVPPFAAYALTFMMTLFTEQLVRERLEGQFDYLVTNTLAPTTYFSTFCFIAYGFQLLPSLTLIVALCATSKWFVAANVPALILMILVFNVVIIEMAVLFSFRFRSREGVGPTIGFGAALSVFLPYFIFEFAVKAEPSTLALVLISVVLPPFGFYRTLASVAVAYAQDRATWALSFSAPLLPVLLVFIAQSVLGAVFISRLANRVETVAATTAANAASARGGFLGMFCGRRTPRTEHAIDTESGAATAAHPNAAIPLDPVLLAIKARLHAPPVAGTADDDDVVRVQGLGMDFGAVNGDGQRETRTVLDDLYFSVPRGTVFGFLSPNSGGKTVTQNILSGLLRPTRGNAYIGGRSVVPFDPKIKRLLGVCPQFDKVFRELTVREHLEVFADIKGIAPHEAEVAVELAIADMQLAPVQHVRSKELSGGNRRRLSIAIACLGRPLALLLDEPTHSVDTSTKRAIWQSIRELKKHTTIILASHDMAECDFLADNVGVMINGSLVCYGAPQRLKSLYGASYKVSLRVANAAKTAEVTAAMAAAFPAPGTVRVTQNLGRSLELEIDLAKASGNADAAMHTTKLPDGRVVLSEAGVDARNRGVATFLARIFDLFRANRAAWTVVDWSVGQSTLAEVFVLLARHHRANIEEEKQVGSV
ncbi:hypothetical protein H9P43_005680 [Blastocladiella emersonii ATCC 22665]|nr:hypothetical protein H9P43_005680 [Blastocladiella emersonii ATCC 22665]